MVKGFDEVNVIQLVSGERKYGLLLKRNAKVEHPHWEFIPTNCVKSYVRTKDKSLVEQVPISMIRYVERIRA